MATSITRRTFRIASIPGDGIGAEVSSAGLQVLRKLDELVGDAFTLELVHFDWNSERFRERGHYIPDDGFEQLRKCDAIYFGAVGSPGM
jgi:isocitrate/isopropylmalate dehydrogenase